MIVIKNNAFKTVHVSLYFIDKIEDDAFAYRFLLTRLLTSYTDSFSTKTKLSHALYDLYGTTISNHIFTFGQYHVIRVNFTFPNPKMLDDAEFTHKINDLIEDMFFNRQEFKEDMFTETKRSILSFIHTKKDRRFEYGKEQMLYYTFNGHSLSKPITGSYQEVANISVTELYDYYKNYFLKNTCWMYASGDITDDFVHDFESITKHSSKNSLKPVKIPDMDKRFTSHETVVDMQQAYIFLGYYLNVERKDPLYVATLLTAIILGGYPESLLFKKVREENYLAYDVEAQFEYDKKYLFVYAGVNKDMKDIAMDLMIDTVNNFIFDGPSDKDLEQAKDYMLNQIYSSLDHQESLIPRQFLTRLLQIDNPFDVYVQMIENVSKDDISKVLSKLKLTTSYVLRGEMNED